MDNIFKDRLEILLNSRGINRQTLANSIDLSPAALSRYVNEFRQPDTTSVIKIAKYFGVTTDWLLGVTDVPYDTETKKVAELYNRALETDKNVIKMILSKYDR